MSWSKEVVTRHIASIESRAASHEERKLQGYTLAKLCKKAQLYSEAIWYLTQYLTLRGDDYKAHRLLAEVYKEHDEPGKALAAYKRSLYFKKNQPDVIIAVGELYCSLPEVSNDELRDWMETVSEVDSNHPILSKLKGKVFLSSKVFDTSLAEEMISDTTSLSEDPSLLINLINRYLTHDNLNEAYMYCRRVQYMGHYRHNINWMRKTLDVHERYLAYIKSTSGGDITRVLLTMISLLEILCDLFELEMRQVIQTRSGVLILLDLLIKFDSVLHTALSYGIYAPSERIQTFLFELKGQFYYLASQYLMGKASEKLQCWQVGVACIVASLFVPPINLSSFKHLPQSDLADMEPWRQRNWARISVCSTNHLVHQLQLVIKLKGEDEIIKCIHECSSDTGRLLATQVLFTDNQFGNRGYDLKTSFMVLDTTLLQITPAIVSQYIKQTNDFDSEYVQQYIDVLPAIVWYCLVHKALYNKIPYDDWVILLFPSLPQTTPLITRGDTDTLCLCDIEAFLVLAMNYYTQSCNEELTVHLIKEGFSWPMVTLPQHLITLYGDVRRLMSSNLSLTEGLLAKKNVSLFLSEVRGHAPLKLNHQQLQALARHFKQRAEVIVSTNSEETAFVNRKTVNVFLDWSANYWSLLLNECSRSPQRLSLTPVRSRSRTPLRGVSHTPPHRQETPLGLFSPQYTKNVSRVFPSDEDKEEALMALGNASLYQHDTQQALAYYQQISTAQSSWNQSQIYVMLSQSDDVDMKALMLEKALTAIKSAVKRSADSDDEVLIQKICKERNRIQALLDSAIKSMPLEKATPTMTSLSLMSHPETSTPVAGNMKETTPTKRDILSPETSDKEKIASMEKKMKYLSEQVMELKHLQSTQSQGSSPQGQRSQTWGSPSGNQFRSPPQFNPSERYIRQPLFFSPQSAIPVQPFQPRPLTHMPPSGNAQVMIQTPYAPRQTPPSHPISQVTPPTYPITGLAPPSHPTSNLAPSTVPLFHFGTPYPPKSFIFTQQPMRAPYEVRPQVPSSMPPVSSPLSPDDGPPLRKQAPSALFSPTNDENYQGFTLDKTVATTHTSVAKLPGNFRGFSMGSATIKPLSGVPQLGGVPSTTSHPLFQSGSMPVPTVLGAPLQPHSGGVPLFNLPTSSGVPFQPQSGSVPPFIPPTSSGAPLHPQSGGIILFNPPTNSGAPLHPQLGSVPPFILPTSSGAPLNLQSGGEPSLGAPTGQPHPQLGGLTSHTPATVSGTSTHHIQLGGVSVFTPSTSTLRPHLGGVSSFTQSAMLGTPIGPSHSQLGHLRGPSPPIDQSGFPPSKPSVSPPPSSKKIEQPSPLIKPFQFLTSSSDTTLTPTQSSPSQSKARPLLTSLLTTPPSSSMLNAQDEPQQSPSFSVGSPDTSIEFTPLVTLPELDEIPTGEENEDTLFSERCKLYRFDEGTKQWKERGTGNIKILKHSQKLKIRLLMRREQILKISCNHYITKDMSLKPFGNTQKAWVWFTPSDFADETAKPEKFVIRFKLISTANAFKTQFDDCVKKLQDNDETDPVNSILIKDMTSEYPLPSTKPPTNWECNMCYVSNKVTDVTCVACGSLKDGGSAKVTSFPSLGASAMPLSANSSFGGFKLDPTKGFSLSNLPTVCSAPSQPTTGGFKLEGFSGPIATAPTVSSALFQPTTGEFTGFSTGPPISTSAVSSVPSQPTTGGFKLEGFSGLIATRPTVSSALFQPTTGGFTGFSTGPPISTSTASSVLSQPTTGGFKLEPLKGFSTGPPISTSAVSSVPSQPTTGGFKLEGPIATRPTVSSALFQPTTGGFTGFSTGPPISTSTASSVLSQPTTGGFKLEPLKGFSSGPEAITPAISSALSQFPSFPSQPGGFDFTACPPVSGKINLLSTFGVPKSPQKEDMTEKEKGNSNEEDEKEEEEEEEEESEGSEGEGESEGEKTEEQQADDKPKVTAAFSFSQLAATQSGFNFDRPSVTEPVLKPLSPRRTGEGGVDEDDPENERELHFKPLVSLPKLENISTGEENDEAIFCQRAKLFRFDNNQWKERGTGEMKILKNKTTNRYRCVMRRDQILKLCCNHCLSPEMTLSPFPGSKKAWMWCAYDFADEDTKSGTEQIPEKLAIRFKTPEIALEFKSAFESGCKGDEHNDTNKIVEAEEKTTESESENEHEQGSVNETLNPEDMELEETDACDVEAEVNPSSVEQVEEVEEEVKMKDEEAEPIPPSIDQIEEEAEENFKIKDEAELNPPSIDQVEQVEQAEEKFKMKDEEVESIPQSMGQVEEEAKEKFKVKDPENDLIPPSIDQVEEAEEELKMKDEEAELNPPTIDQVEEPEEEVKVKDKQEDILFSGYATLHTTDRETNCVKEKGRGSIEILKHKITGEIHVHMITEDTGKILCSHVVDSLSSLRKRSDSSSEKLDQEERERSRVWSTTADCSSGSKQVEWFCAVFPTIIDAERFHQAFLSGHGLQKVVPYEQKEPVLVTDLLVEAEEEEDIVFLHEELPSSELMEKAVALQLPKTFYNYLTKPDCPGCLGCRDDVNFPTHQDQLENVNTDVPPPLNTPTTDIPTKDEKPELPTQLPSILQVTPPNLGATATGGFFSTTGFNFQSFGDLAKSDDSFDNSFKADSNFKFAGAGRLLFSSNTTAANEEEDEDNPEEEATIHFKPIVTLPENYEYKSGEENGEIIFNERGKLFRYDSTVKQWKERGIGNMKIIRYSETGQTRLIMRRDQILKLCCNHYLTSEMTIETHMDNPKAYKWFTKADYSEEVGRHDQFIIRFKLVETAVKFKELFEKGVEESAKLAEKSPVAVPFVDKEEAYSDMLTCSTCYIKNESVNEKCVACQTPYVLDNEEASLLSQYNMPPLEDIVPEGTDEMPPLEDD